MNRYITHSHTSLFQRFSLNRIDFSLLVPPLFLVFLSLTTFYFIDISIFRQQLSFLAVSIIAYLIFLNIDYRIFRYYSSFVYVGMILLLLVLFIIGVEAKGAIRWIDLFGIRIQFSEIIKPFFVIFFASFLSANESRSFSKFVKCLVLLFPLFFLTLRQPDLGNALIYVFTCLFMLLMYGFPVRHFLALFFAVGIPFPILFNFLHDYQRKRLLTFFNTTNDPFGSSYNAIQSLISIGSGGFGGKGFGHATQSILRFLPERHTDFIFATILESLGFIGGIFIISLFAYFFYRIYSKARGIGDTFSHLVVFGFYFLFLTHVFLNMGMNVGIVPIVGITLPFLSYGGSSLLTNFIILGILSSILFEYRTKRTLEIR